MRLNLFNTLTKVSYDIENLSDLQSNSINYAFDVVLPEGIDNGEYNFSLFNDEETLVATGLLQIGSYEAPKTAYTAQTINGYTQYEG